MNRPGVDLVDVDGQRAALAAEESSLLRALVRGEAAPPGYDPKRVALTASGLRQKRKRSLLRAWPIIEATLGEATEERLASYFAARPSVPEAGPWADGAHFLTWLTECGHVPHALAREALRLRLDWRWRRNRWVRRGGFRFATIRPMQDARLIAVAGPAWLGGLLGGLWGELLGGTIRVLRCPRWPVRRG
jgi:hypothetical protein